MVRFVSLPTLVVCLAACGGKDGSPKPHDTGTPSVEGPVDADLDGVLSDSDCNDGDADIHPGASEACNGLDDDCNGTVDDDLLATFYRDLDHDGFGDAADVASACTLPDGYVSDATDCDDRDGAVNPGETEICDLEGVDEDCNDLVNEADAGPADVRTWYVDADEDGYGGASSTVEACFEGPGLATLGTDCDDGDGDVNPGAPEVCDALDKDEDCDGFRDTADPEGPLGQPLYYIDVDGDQAGDDADPGQYFCDGVPPGYSTLGTDCDDVQASINPNAPENCRDAIDNDCNGAVDDCGPIPDISLATADSILYGTESQDYVGFDVADLGDVDGDGNADFGASGPYASSDSGKGWIFSGPIAEGTDLDANDEAVGTIMGSTFGDLGYTMRGAGDVDADGFDDVITGKYRDTGEAYVLLGPIRGALTASSAADAIWVGEDVGDGAGQTVEGGFDFNADGFDDYVIGAMNASVVFPYDGAAYLVFGPGLGSDLSLSDADAKFVGSQIYDTLGYSVAGLGDVDGDGTDNLAVGALQGGDYDQGRAYVFTGGGGVGGVLDADTEAAAWVEGTNSYDSLGNTVADGGDFNDDGYADLLVTAPYASTGTTDSGSAYLIAGPIDTSGSAATIAYAEFYGESYYANAGRGADGSKDVNRDGFTDVLVGAPYADLGGGVSDVGSTYLVYGPQSGTTALSGARCNMMGVESYENSGSAVAFIGDQDGDDGPEILIGAPYNDVGTSESGALYIVSGDRL